MHAHAGLRRVELAEHRVDGAVRCRGDERERVARLELAVGRHRPLAKDRRREPRLPVFEPGERVKELHGTAGLVEDFDLARPRSRRARQTLGHQRIGIGVEPLHVETETRREPRTDLVVRAALADPIDHRGDALARERPV